MRPKKRGNVDELDFNILNLMLSEFSNADIAAELHKPLSTIQRRSTHSLVRTSQRDPRRWQTGGVLDGLI